MEDIRKYEIPQWQIDEVRERTTAYFKNPESALDFDEVIKEIEDELYDLSGF
ncbi:MAG TPA: addiction module protein [Flavobacterium sp.]|nr:addiction module protein [Flavobacterium sp.]